jgi:hypothetical protein
METEQSVPVAAFQMTLRDHAFPDKAADVIGVNAADNIFASVFIDIPRLLVFQARFFTAETQRRREEGATNGTNSHE